jgi:hydroxymethylbilane synthase
MRLTIGSRGSQLALWQANWVKDRLAALGYEAEIQVIRTTGDKMQGVPLTSAGAKGLFIKEIEEALIDHSIDLAVHSMKDLPTDQPEGLSVAAVPEREDPRDVLISRNGQLLRDLPATSRLGTSSLRRQAQVRSLGREFEIVPVRGNLDTRLRKLDRGDCDALILAAAGVHRLGLQNRITAYFAPEEMCPAVGQGALAIEVRLDDERTGQAVAPLDHRPTHLAVRAERATLHALGGGCQVPIAAYATLRGSELHLIGLVASVDGARIIRAAASGPKDDPENLGKRVARDLLAQGAQSILNSIP